MNQATQILRDNLFLLRNAFIENRKNIWWMAPFLLLSIWTVDSFVSLFITGFTGWTWAFTVAFLLRMTVIAVNIFFIKKLFLLNTRKSYRHLKTYTGYFLVFVYVFYNLPRMSLVENNAISREREITMFISALVSSLYPFVLYIVLWYRKTQESWGVYKDKKTLKEERKKGKSRRSWKDRLWENVDAVISSIITVIILQHFIFQLYVIPSESMVPTFLMNDRTFVTKFMSGPGLPLTEWKLPRLREPRKGEIIVFQSPDYTYPGLAKRVFQQFVFYITLTTVDLDRDEYGNIRKRFIVKRLTGVPDEKYMMVDDILYIRTPDEKDFRVDETDRRYANYNLYLLPDSIKKDIKDPVIDQRLRNEFDYWDKIKNSASMHDLESGIRNLSTRLAQITENITFEQRELFFASYSHATSGNISPTSRITEIREKLQIAGIGPFQDIKSLEYDILFFYDYLSGNSSDIDALSKNALRHDGEELDLFEQSSRKLNLLIKTIQLERLVHYAQMVEAAIPYGELWFIEEYQQSTIKLNKLAGYLLYFDYRNFPQFPAGKNDFIPKDQYFLIGDNRYNSLDFRYDHSGFKLRYLDKTDTGSIVYYSNLGPYLLEKENILGFAHATFWPFHRAKWLSR